MDWQGGAHNDPDCPKYNLSFAKNSYLLTECLVDKSHVLVYFQPVCRNHHLASLEVPL